MSAGQQLSQQTRADRRLRKLRKTVLEFGCPVCMCSMYETCDARVALCGHTLCSSCWRRLSWPLDCPLCRSVLINPPEPNYQLNDLMTEVRTIVSERYHSEEVQWRKAIRSEERSIQREERELKVAIIEKKKQLTKEKNQKKHQKRLR